MHVTYLLFDEARTLHGDLPPDPSSMPKVLPTPFSVAEANGPMMLISILPKNSSHLSDHARAAFLEAFEQPVLEAIDLGVAERAMASNVQRASRDACLHPPQPSDCLQADWLAPG
jgi:hypothetical protein